MIFKHCIAHMHTHIHTFGFNSTVYFCGITPGKVQCKTFLLQWTFWRLHALPVAQPIAPEQ